MKLDAVKIFSTFFGIGYLPYCPGTWASLAGVGIYLLLHNNFIIYLAVAILSFLVGILICAKAEEKFNKKDAPFIVIDEVAAILILLIFVPENLFFLLLAFLLFRIFDVIKPYPIKKIEHFPGSWGIMLDDIIACFYSWIIIFLVNMFIRR
ncbi:MAG: phosphatidylglycerophosphatase A [Candidatus Omnitrophica bacterium]|nr:phosphatidylglycerophosphatase A [Candidatus Omnitrophota bacterium]MDD5352824.1 phosphatidylglycerophosphatase A [Candidatus Omnitrophota bacterium]MDD5550423.1 phosphatidylglycerophosphatase A [Candidatus Omnitrophota bacterium]